MVHGTLHTALAQTVTWAEVAHNVAAKVRPPKSSAPDMRTLTADQAKALLTSVGAAAIALRRSGGSCSTLLAASVKRSG